jgi:hypothetical protein
VSRVRWTVRPDGTLRPVAQGPRCRCAWCGRLVPVRWTWLVAGEPYCAVHFSVDDRRLHREFEEATT